LLNVLEESIYVGKLPLSCRRAVVCRQPKTGNLQKVQNWRPVSLLCADYKIFWKVLANRVKVVVGSVVHPDQTYCVPGRSIHDNNFLVRDSLSCDNYLRNNHGLLFIDQVKAFDRVDHITFFLSLKGWVLENISSLM